MSSPPSPAPSPTLAPERVDAALDTAKTHVDKLVTEVEALTKPVPQVPVVADEREAAAALGGTDGAEAQEAAVRASLAGSGATSYSSKAFAPPGTPVLTTHGTGIILSYNEAEDSHRVRLGAPRGDAAGDAYLARSSLVRIVAAAVGFAVRTPEGRGTVVDFRPAANPRPYSGPPKLKTVAGASGSKGGEAKGEGAAAAEGGGAEGGEAEVEEEEEEKEEALSEDEDDVYVIAMAPPKPSTPAGGPAEGAAASAAEEADAGGAGTETDGATGGGGDAGRKQGVFRGSVVECVGGSILPTMVWLDSQATKFLHWSSTQIDGLLDGSQVCGGPCVSRGRVGGWVGGWLGGWLGGWVSGGLRGVGGVCVWGCVGGCVCACVCVCVRE